MTKTSPDATRPSAGASAPPGDAFLISRGGPFFALQEQLGLLSQSALNSRPRAAIAVALAAGAPLLLSFLLPGADGAGAMLLDPAFHARNVIAIAVCFLMERTVETRLREMLGRFARTDILLPSARPKMAAAVAEALRLRNNALAEAVCLALASVVAAVSAQWRLSAGEPGWAVLSAPEGVALSPAGWWVAAVSTPLLWFLILRWMWRYAVWAWLLTRIAKLEMRLVATHPDRAGGIAFLGRYPNAFAMFAFALAAIVAASAWNRLAGTEVMAAAYGQVLATWLALVLAVFVLPLAAFARPLSHLREETLVLCSRQETRRERVAERRTLSAHAVFPEEAAAPGEAEPSDTKAFREAAQKLKTVPFSRPALLPLAAAALAPLLLVGAALFKTAELLKISKSLLFF